MNPRFKEIVESLDPKLKALVAMPPVTRDQLPQNMPKQGIYLFSEGQEHLYVGRSDNIRKRLGLHCRASSQHNQATFAFRIARGKTGRTDATYTVEGSRRALLSDSEFLEAFERSKQAIRAMDIRFVEEKDPTRQALLEIYAATALETKYNDFENH